MLNELFDLNERFFELYGSIRENTENLSRKQYDFMQEKLFEQYKLEYSKLSLKKEIEDKGVLFALKMRFSGYAPLKFLFFKNTAFKLLRNQIDKELNEYFEDKFKDLNVDDVNGGNNGNNDNEEE